MAWDKDRPYAPFWNCTDYLAQDYGSMDSYGSGEDITAENIDVIYAAGEYLPTRERWNSTTAQWEDYPSSYVWRPFREVALKLRLDRFEQRRAAGIFWWRDEDGHKYPMFAKEFNRLAKEGLLSLVIDGVWSAEKRGANYGIRLVRQ